MKTRTPTAKTAVFLRNAVHYDLFDLTANSGVCLPFSFFRVSKPRSEYLTQQRAVFYAESFSGSRKVLNTGFRATNRKGVYYGDMINSERKKSLIIFRLDDEDTIKVYLFENYYTNRLHTIDKITLL